MAEPRDEKLIIASLLKQLRSSCYHMGGLLDAVDYYEKMLSGYTCFTAVGEWHAKEARELIEEVSDD